MHTGATNKCGLHLYQYYSWTTASPTVGSIIDTQGVHRQRLDFLLLFLHNTDPIRCEFGSQGDDNILTFNTGALALFSARQMYCFHVSF
jgi:hypothetical protein